MALAELVRLLSQSLAVVEIGQRIVDSVQRVLEGTAANLYRGVDPGGDLVTLAVSGDAASHTRQWREQQR